MSPLAHYRAVTVTVTLYLVADYYGDVERGAPLRRTGIARGTADLRRVPLARTAPTSTARSLSPSRHTVAPVSARRKALNRDLAAVVAEKRRTVRYCEGQPLLKAALMDSRNTPADTARYVKALQECSPLRPERPHHKLKRSRGSDATLISADVIVMLCPSCDDFSESEVALSTRAGLLIPSSAVKRLFGRIA